MSDSKGICLKRDNETHARGNPLNIIKTYKKH